MSLHSNPEEKMQNMHLKMRELFIQIENLDREFNQLFKDLQMTPEELNSHVNNEANFSSTNWETLQSEKKKLDEKLDLSLANIKNPLKVKKTFSERGSVQSHWIFVR